MEQTKKEKELKSVKSKSIASVVSLLAQGSYAAALGFVAFFVLTITSGAYLLGIYNTVLATLSSFNYFTNLGLAAAILQKKDVKQIDLNSAFYIQFGLTVFAVLVGFWATPHVFDFYPDLPESAKNLYWAVLASFFLLSLKTIPSVLLEKELEIYKVAAVQALEFTIFYGTIIVMVLMGYEFESLIVAVLLRSICGVGLIFYLRPWMPSASFSWTSAKRLLKYGIPFQGNSFLALLKDDLLTIYLGRMIGFTYLGYVTFGKKYAEFSIRLIMDNVNRVAFPLFAKFQNDADMLKKSLKKVLFYESFFIFAIVIGALFVFDTVLKIVPGGYYAKWEQALFSFYFFSISSLLVSLYSPLINLFNAIGKVKTSLYIMMLLTLLTWILVPTGIALFGFNGVSIAFACMQLPFFLIVKKAKQYVDFSFVEFIRTNLIAGLVMAIILGFIRIATLSFANDYVYFIAALLFGAISYIGTVYKLKGLDVFIEIFELLPVRITRLWAKKSL